MSTVYHFTDTDWLPRILAAGELQPRLYYSFYSRPPLADFLWATTSTWPEPTSHAVHYYIKGYYAPKGQTKSSRRLVRFTLAARDFVPFDKQAIIKHWGPNNVYLLEREIRFFGQLLVKKWRVRPGALPLTRVIRIEILARSGQWKPLTAGVKERMLEEGICEELADAHYAKKDEEEEDDYDDFEH